MTYSATTMGIEVSVEPFYLEAQSSPDQGRFVWSYRVTIVNQSEKSVQLESRYWHITDAQGTVEEVRGPGVVGEQPILNPGDSFQYSSGCPLKTSSGIMTGHYQMRDENGVQFNVSIPAFSLDIPSTLRTLN